MGLGAFVLGLLQVTGTAQSLAIAAVWRGLGALAFMLAKPSETRRKNGKSISYKGILTQRSFLLYFIPWVMFCLINQVTNPVIFQTFGKEFADLSMALDFALLGISALVSGVICDKIGRRRVAIFGFVMLGVGYAALGLFPQATTTWYFYVVADGVAWGAFYAIFFMTIWGDLASEAPSEKYYAIGGLPYLLSNFLRYALGPLIADTVAIYTIFSLASFFLFLAVLPLMYAPETLPEGHIKERELKIYVAKARKVKEKYA
jgi:MFS family permease